MSKPLENIETALDEAMERMSVKPEAYAMEHEEASELLVLNAGWFMDGHAMELWDQFPKTEKLSMAGAAIDRYRP